MKTKLPPLITIHYLQSSTDCGDSLQLFWTREELDRAIDELIRENGDQDDIRLLDSGDLPSAWERFQKAAADALDYYSHGTQQLPLPSHLKLNP